MIIIRPVVRYISGSWGSAAMFRPRSDVNVCGSREMRMMSWYLVIAQKPGKPWPSCQ
jgi:hypothetical protein